MNVLKGIVFVAGATLALTNVHAANIVDTTLLNNTTNDVSLGDEAPGEVNSISVSSQYGGVDNPKEAFGEDRVGEPIEPGTFLFADPNSNPNTITFGTVTPVRLTGLEFIGGGAGPDVGDPRRISEIKIYSGATLLYDTGVQASINGTNDYIFSAPVTASSFELSITGEDCCGPRISEINAIVPEPSSAALCGFGGVGMFLAVRRRRTA